MNQFRTANPRRLAIFAALFVIFNLAMFFLARDLIREMIVLPIAYILFVIGVFLDSTPELFFWLAVLLISGWIAYRSLYKRRKVADFPTMGRVVPEEPGGSMGRMSFWANKVNVARRYRGSYFSSGLHLSMSRLLVDMLAHRYRMTTVQVETRIRNRTLGVPPEIEEYLLTSMNRQENSDGRIRRLWQDILMTIRKWFLWWPAPQDNEKSPAVNALKGIDQVIHYMEEELEVSHEHPGQSSR